MKVFCAILTIVLGIGAAIFLAAAGFDYISSTNDINQILGLSNYYFIGAIVRGAIGLLLGLSAIGTGQYAWKK